MIILQVIFPLLAWIPIILIGWACGPVYGVGATIMWGVLAVVLIETYLYEKEKDKNSNKK